MTRICKVYRSKKKEGAYLIVDAKKDLAELPEALLSQFGVAEQAMMMTIEPDKKMARTSGDEVLKAIEDQGFYFQMPPLADREMSEISEKNSKLAR